jgi:hypothetical protein
MENNQTTNQEKPFDDKRKTPTENGSIFSPKYVSIDEMSLKKFDEEVLKRYAQNAIYGAINRPVFRVPNGSTRETEDETPEEWIWVEGYKATNADMKCKNYQYKLGKRHDMPEGSIIRDCESGFHLCRDLSDVFAYYGLHSNNRFFRVHALVRKEDFEDYGTIHSWRRSRNKLAAKSIVFVRELTNDEVFKGTDAENWSEEDKNTARAHGIQHVKDLRNAEKLVALGYSKAFAEYIVGEGHFQAAYAAGTQEGLSMDMKVAYIMANEC